MKARGGRTRKVPRIGPLMAPYGLPELSEDDRGRIAKFRFVVDHRETEGDRFVLRFHDHRVRHVGD